MKRSADTTPFSSSGGMVGAREATWRKRWRRMSKSRPMMIGVVLTLIIVIVAIFAPVVAPTDPLKMDYVAILQPPSSSHWFGTDEFGRDVYSRVVWGSRISLRVASQVALVTLVFGLVIGVLSGFYRRLDNVLMRVMDLMMAFPDVLLAIAVMSVLGPRLENVIIALSVVYVPRSARVVRSVVLGLREREYVEASRALGSRDVRTMLIHVIPNTVPALVVQQTFVFAYSVLAEATLSFLGIGAEAGVPSWGNILSDSRNLLQVAPWLILIPGVVLSAAVMGINLLGDGLRDVLDPRMRR